MHGTPEQLELLLAALGEIVQADDVQREALAASEREYFRVAPRDPADDLAGRRHLEWFLLERDGSRAGTSRIDDLRQGSSRALALLDDATVTLLRGSFCGLFEVVGVAAGSGCWVRDLSGHGEYPVQEPSASLVFERGDLVVGRLFPLDGGTFAFSRACAYFRDSRLSDALRADLERARAGRRGTLRLSQREVEAMFFGARAPSENDPVGEARTYLHESGLSAEDVDLFLEDLAQEPFDETAVIHGGDDALGAVLDRLAFETEIDLDRARRILVRAWRAFSKQGAGNGPSITPTAPPAPVEVVHDPAEAIARFDAARRAGKSLDDSFLELERALELDDASDADDEAPAPDFPGVVGAMVEEFLWETGHEFGSKRALELERVRAFGNFARDVGVFENLGTRELEQYCCFWLPESGLLTSSDEALAQLSSLQQFARWCEERHEVALASSFKDTFGKLERSLPRIAEANQRRTRATDPDDGSLLVVEELERERASVRTTDQRSFDVRIEHDLAQWLRAGDHLRGRITDGQLAVYCCYPPEAAALAAR